MLSVLFVAGCSKYNADIHDCDNWIQSACYPDTSDNREGLNENYDKIQDCPLNPYPNDNRGYIQGLECKEWHKKSG